MKMTYDFVEKCRQANIGRKSHRKGLTLDDEYGERAEEVRKNISNSHKGKTSHRKGKSMIEEYGEERAKEIIKK